MIEIISHGKAIPVKEFSCDKCNTVFTAEADDYEVWDGNGYAPTYYKVVCPHCHDTLIYNSKDYYLVHDTFRGVVK
jgi:hypothetical protein